MRNHLKPAALGIALAFGAAGAAHAAQESTQPVQGQMPPSAQGMAQPGMMAGTVNRPMAGDARMGQRMSAMMERCRRMMSRMDAGNAPMPGMPERR